MFQIKTINKISPLGLDTFNPDRYQVSEEVSGAHAIILRSASLHDYEFPPELLAVARAGAGYNNIPVDRAAEMGIAVFNTPGANANAVKELALAALLLTARDITGGVQWMREEAAKGSDVAAIVEKGKARFAGVELSGKTLGVVGLGAIGALLANAALGLGMQVVGYDPYLTVPAALRLDPRVRTVEALPALYAAADYLSLHLPFTPETKGSVNAAAFAQMKDGVRLINLSRGELVDDADMKAALEAGKVAAYATDFPNSALASLPGVVPIPHLGASTGESEDNCAVMAAAQIQDYLENGNLVNSVNFPPLRMDWRTSTRLAVLFKADGSGPVAPINATVTDGGVQVSATASAVRGGYGYMLLDTEGDVPAAVLEALRGLDGVLRVRVMKR